jgi:hypothetical protein
VTRSKDRCVKSACDLLESTGHGENSMLERAIPSQHQRIVFDEKLEARASSSGVATLRRLY